MSCLFICKLPGLSCNDTAAASWTIGSEEDGPAVPCRGSLHHAGSQRSVAGDPACGPGGGLPRQSPGRWRRASGLLPSLSVHQKGRIDLAQREFVNSQYPRHTRLGHGKPVTLAPSRRHAPRPTAPVRHVLTTARGTAPGPTWGCHLGCLGLIMTRCILWTRLKPTWGSDVVSWVECAYWVGCCDGRPGSRRACGAGLGLGLAHPR